MTNFVPEIEASIFDTFRVEAPNGAFMAQLAYAKEIGDGSRTELRLVPVESADACGQSRIMVAGGRVDFDRDTVDIVLEDTCRNSDCGCRCRLNLELVG